MSKPVIAAIDVRHEDVAPAALGAMLARLLGEPLIVVTAYPVALSIDNLIPDYADALAREARKAADRVAQAVDGARSGVSVTGMAVDAPGSIAKTLHSLAEREDARCSCSALRGAAPLDGFFRARSPIACCTARPARWPSRPRASR